MPAYSASTASLPITAIYPGDSATVWNAEQPASGTYSQAVCIAPNPAPFGGAQYISVELHFAGLPGAFAVEVQCSDTEADADYVSENFGSGTPGQVTAANSNNSARVELLVKAKFVRLKSTTQNANAVNLTAKISR